MALTSDHRVTYIIAMWELMNRETLIPNQNEMKYFERNNENEDPICSIEEGFLLPISINISYTCMEIRYLVQVSMAQ